MYVNIIIIGHDNMFTCIHLIVFPPLISMTNFRLNFLFISHQLFFLFHINFSLSLIRSTLDIIAIFSSKFKSFHTPPNISEAIDTPTKCPCSPILIIMEFLFIFSNKNPKFACVIYRNPCLILGSQSIRSDHKVIKPDVFTSIMRH